MLFVVLFSLICVVFVYVCVVVEYGLRVCAHGARPPSNMVQICCKYGSSCLKGFKRVRLVGLCLSI